MTDKHSKDEKIPTDKPNTVKKNAADGSRGRSRSRSPHPAKSSRRRSRSRSRSRSPKSCLPKTDGDGGSLRELMLKERRKMVTSSGKSVSHLPSALEFLKHRTMGDMERICEKVKPIADILDQLVQLMIQDSKKQCDFVRIRVIPYLRDVKSNKNGGDPVSQDSSVGRYLEYVSYIETSCPDPQHGRGIDTAGGYASVLNDDDYDVVRGRGPPVHLQKYARQCYKSLTIKKYEMPDNVEIRTHDLWEWFQNERLFHPPLVDHSLCDDRRTFEYFTMSDDDTLTEEFKCPDVFEINLRSVMDHQEQDMVRKMIHTSSCFK